MSAKICQSCQGRKKVIGLGMMEKTCEVCNGLGFVSAEVKTESKPEVIPTITVSANAGTELPAVQKRRGRPPKSV